MKTILKKEDNQLRRMFVRSIHGVVVMWIFVGSIAVWLFPVYTMFHVMLVGLTGASQRYFGSCPLTKFENRLRISAGLPPFEGNSCIQHTTGIPYRTAKWLMGATIANAVVVLAIHLR